MTDTSALKVALDHIVVDAEVALRRYTRLRAAGQQSRDDQELMVVLDRILDTLGQIPVEFFDFPESIPNFQAVQLLAIGEGLNDIDDQRGAAASDDDDEDERGVALAHVFNAAVAVRSAITALETNG